MRRQSILVVLALLTLPTLACGLLDNLPGQEQATATQPPAEPEGTQLLPGSNEPQKEPRTRVVDEMTIVHIPAGEFWMGDDASAFAPEKPGHAVILSEYWIDRTEVTNAQYRLCVEEGTCAESKSWENPGLNGDLQPALVSWESAQAYCAWVGGRLPTEAEWEKAARGTDGRTWPWGNEWEAGRANLSGDTDGYGGTAPVGSFPADTNPYGLLDVAGNAAEWVSDWYDREYYARSPTRDPTGPVSGDRKVQRGTIANGGGGPEKCRCTARYAADPNWEFGFRCAITTPPE